MAFRAGNLTGIRLDHPGETFHQSGFSGTVGSSKGNPVFLTQNEREPVKQDTGSDLYAELLNGQHGAEVA